MFAAAMELRQKDKRNGLQMKHQCLASSDFPPVACFRCRMPFKRVDGSGKVFGRNTLKPV